MTAHHIREALTSGVNQLRARSAHRSLRSFGEREENQVASFNQRATQQIVGRERRGRVSHHDSSGDA